MLLLLHPGPARGAQTHAAATLPKFPLRPSGLELERRTQAGSFYDVVGRRSAAFGYEHRGMEAWVHPLKILDDFELSFRVEGYPLEFRGADTLVGIRARPEATVFTYSHAAFTVRQTVFAPVDEPGVVILLDVDSVLPLTVTASFRPKLRLAWPAGLMTANLDWNEKQHVYYLVEETKRFVGVVGSPAARDLSAMPYQEEPRDVPARFVIEAPAGELKAGYVPIVIAGSVGGREDAKAAYDRLLGSARELYEKNVAHYERLQRETVGVTTPDERFNAAYAWAKVGVDKGLATNPLLGTGLVAGFRTSGESERPGFAWFFGRDALWTALAVNSYGDFAVTRAALEFLKKFQRADGKIPHEISQSASLIPWFTDYPYPWASADATPLYVIVHADYWRATGDEEFLKANWDSVVRAYRFTEATDTDGNGLVENTKFGHGWVEGGALYPPHEEIYMQGLWVAASRDMAEMAEALKDSALAARARAAAERTRAAAEQTFWLAERGFYAFATKLQAEPAPTAEPGPNRDVRQARMNELARSRLYDEDTVLPAVPLWFAALSAERAQSEIDHLGSASLATDWGQRIISAESKLYDPLSYHYGSVWPLFTGWASVGAYRYGRPHVGRQALMATALLTYTNALGYVTELLSGDFNAPFGRSSHHQVWSEAMVITPALRGMLGIEAGAGGTALRFAPQLPAHWDRVEVRGVAAGRGARYDLSVSRAAGRTTLRAARRGGEAAQGSAATRLTLAPAFPLDARLRAVTSGGRDVPFEVRRLGDVQVAEARLELRQPSAEVVFTYDEGTDVYVEPAPLRPGARSEGLLVIRSRAERDTLRLVLEGRGGRSYELRVRSKRELGDTEGVTVRREGRDDARLAVAFEGDAGGYVRRELNIPLRRNGQARRR
ncbi:MAG TPA: GH116 family glycosyl hydrolase [Pyrinomonadaceae bacterium]|nr:GH116 family glycosyl hydrolase [Pyrinomonadaceae bacterium]